MDRHKSNENVIEKEGNPGKREREIEKKHDIQNAAEKRALNLNTIHSRTYTANILN